MIADVFPTPVADDRRIDDRLTFKSGLTYTFFDGTLFSKAKNSSLTIPIALVTGITAERNHQLVVSLLLPVFFLFIAPPTLLYP